MAKQGVYLFERTMNTISGIQIAAKILGQKHDDMQENVVEILKIVRSIISWLHFCIYFLINYIYHIQLVLSIMALHFCIYFLVNYIYHIQLVWSIMAFHLREL
ncbi:unnamed protein product [Cuscuta epithymum]|uniref:Uncharacterized protein n=1 Tax=Cuscuta epithymum TaxID=186058 RepID=A0AAV0F604_9ASTE|nr:unnamed protein product [Cuscuta epithymum]